MLAENAKVAEFCVGNAIFPLRPYHLFKEQTCELLQFIFHFAVHP